MIYDIQNLSFSYGKKDKLVFQNLNLQIQEGDLLTILGHNGCGKSTLYSCMLGLSKPKAGQILLQGQPLDQLSPRQIARIVGFVPQNHHATFPYSVFEFVLMGCAAGVGLLSHPGKKEREQASNAIEQMGLEELADRPYTDLSGGERQLVTIARAIAANPQVILFDEPTAHLDMGKQSRVLKIVKELSHNGYTIVITTHDPNHPFLLGGKTGLFLGGNEGLVVGTPDQVLTEERLQYMYGEELKLRYLEEFGRKVCITP